jgi:hypothetical protein
VVQSIDGRSLSEVVYKACSKCKISKPATKEFFYIKRAKLDNLDSWCKSCHKKYQEKNFESHRIRNKNYHKKCKKRAIEYLGGQCQCCGFKKAMSVLQFHHRDPAEKEGDFKKIRGMSPEKRKEELDKCDLLCANCHFGFHAGAVIYDENGYTWKVDHPNYASMAESVDAPDLKSVDL